MACSGLFAERGKNGTAVRSGADYLRAVGGQPRHRAAVPRFGETRTHDLGDHGVHAIVFRKDRHVRSLPLYRALARFPAWRVTCRAMRAVVQRVSRASVAVNGTVVGAIEEPGLLVLVGVTHDDTPEQASRLAAKLWGLRILDGEKSCSDIGAPLLMISQFTLYADLAKGRRPSWSAAAPGPVAEPLVGAVVRALRDLGARVETGVFGADMKVSLVNDGPVTIVDLRPV